MSQHPPDGPEAEHVASKNETISAWKAMTREDKIRLNAFAEVQARIRQRYDPGISGSDLLNEAALRAFEGTREWQLRKISFLQYMFGIVRSISGDLKRTNAGKLAAATMSESNLQPADDEEGSPRFIEELCVERDTPEGIAIAKEQFVAFQSDFEDDEATWYVLECMSMGHSGPEIQRRLGITAKQLDAARKKIVRRAHKFFLNN